VPLAIAAEEQDGGLVVADDGFGSWVEMKDPTDPRPDVGEVHQGRGSVTDHHIGVGHPRFADAIEEILLMGRDVGRAGTLGDLLVLGPVRLTQHDGRRKTIPKAPV
jgi:hypothetical protein